MFVFVVEQESLCYGLVRQIFARRQLLSCPFLSARSIGDRWVRVGSVRSPAAVFGCIVEGIALSLLNGSVIPTQWECI